MAVSINLRSLLCVLTTRALLFGSIVRNRDPDFWKLPWIPHMGDSTNYPRALGTCNLPHNCIYDHPYPSCSGYHCKTYDFRSRCQHGAALFILALYGGLVSRLHLLWAK